MDINTIAHDLTMLYLQNSVKLSDYNSPGDYVEIYKESYDKIFCRLSKPKYLVDKKAGVIAHGF